MAKHSSSRLTRVVPHVLGAWLVAVASACVPGAAAAEVTGSTAQCGGIEVATTWVPWHGHRAYVSVLLPPEYRRVADPERDAWTDGAAVLTVVSTSSPAREFEVSEQPACVVTGPGRQASIHVVRGSDGVDELLALVPNPFWSSANPPPVDTFTLRPASAASVPLLATIVQACIGAYRRDTSDLAHRDIKSVEAVLKVTGDYLAPGARPTELAQMYAVEVVNGTDEHVVLIRPGPADAKGRECPLATFYTVPMQGRRRKCREEGEFGSLKEYHWASLAPCDAVFLGEIGACEHVNGQLDAVSWEYDSRCLRARVAGSGQPHGAALRVRLRSNAVTFSQ
jgi:hypothetical protein